MIGKKSILGIMVMFCVLGLAACSSSKQGTTKRTGSGSRGSVEFLDGLSINGNSYAAKSKSTLKFTASSPSIENAPLWQFKYAQLLDVRVETVLNTNLFAFIEDWWGTPYVYGGKNQNGVDCSGFTNNLLVSVFRLNSSGSSRQLYEKARKLSRSEMREGDLVFFKTDGKSISHVGVYLNNNKFVHASTSLGVTISDLNETYWARYYAGSGRIE